MAYCGTDVALVGVTIKLQGVDDLGQTVVLTTLTEADGSYNFTSLRAGKYTIWEEQPMGLIDVPTSSGRSKGPTLRPGGATR